MRARAAQAWLAGALALAAASRLPAQNPAQNPAQSPAQAPAQAPAFPPNPPTAPAAGTAQPSANPAGDPDRTGKASETGKPIELGKPIQASSLHAQREAARFYLQGAKLLEKQKPELAWNLLKRAAELEPGNATYLRAAELARQSTVTQLVQQAARLRDREAGLAAAGGSPGGITASPNDAALLLQRAQAIDPANPLVLEHLDKLAGSGAAQAGAQIGATSSTAPGLRPDPIEHPSQVQDTLAAGPIVLLPKREKHSFHMRASQRQLVADVFRAYGIEATVSDASANRSETGLNKQVRLDVDDATFPEAMRVLALLTNTFYEPIDPHRVVVAIDTRENRQQFERLQIETVYLGGLNEKELTEVTQLAHNLFDAQQSTVQNSAGTMTIRASARTLDAFNRTVAQLEQGKSQVDLDVKVIQLSHIANRETGAQLFQTTGVYNAFSEINSILTQNASAVQQILASGIVPNANGLQNQLTIIGILLAAGSLTGPPFNQGVLLFGNGISASLLSVSPATLTMSLTGSDTRVLDDIHLQLADQEEGTFKIGERYPIETSQFSSVALPAIAGISATASAAASQIVPQVQYQDIGLTLKATPKVMRSNDVALTIDLKIDALGGTALNSIPILNSQQVSGVVTLMAGETAMLVSDLSSTESRALSGLPGIGDIPGLQDFNDIQKDRNVARLLILVTPSVVRNIQSRGHGPILMVDKPVNSHSFN